MRHVHHLPDLCGLSSAFISFDVDFLIFVLLIETHTLTPQNLEERLKDLRIALNALTELKDATFYKTVCGRLGQA